MVFIWLSTSSYYLGKIGMNNLIIVVILFHDECLTVEKKWNKIRGENSLRIGYVLRQFERTTNVISIHIIYYRSYSIRLVDLFF